MHDWLAGFNEKALFFIKIYDQWHLDKINEAIAAVRENGFGIINAIEADW